VASSGVSDKWKALAPPRANHGLRLMRDGVIATMATPLRLEHDLKERDASTIIDPSTVIDANTALPTTSISEAQFRLLIDCRLRTTPYHAIAPDLISPPEHAPC
jgi:hypothetical protein